VIAGTASDENNTSTVSNVSNKVLDTSELNLILLEVNSSSHRVDDSLCLLHNLLHHEMLVSSHIDLSGVDLQSLQNSVLGLVSFLGVVIRILSLLK